VQGEQAVTISGAGKIVLSAPATGIFNPGLTANVTIDSGTLELQDVGALGTAVLANAANVIVNGGAFYYNGPNNTAAMPPK